MIKEKALKIWDDEIGEQEYYYDFTGKKIKRSDYKLKNQVGWLIAPIKPFAHGGPRTPNNMMIMHHRTIEDKADHYPKFTIINKEYIIKYDEADDFYYIEEILEEIEADDYYNI